MIRLSTDQISQTLSLLPFLEKARAELSTMLGERTEKSEQFLKPGLAWVNLHQLALPQQMAIYFEIAGISRFMASASAAADPFAELAKLDAHPDYQEWKGGTDQKYGPQHLLGCLLAMLGSIESLVLYGFYLSELLWQFKSNGNDGALFKAITIDPTIIGAHIASHRLAQAAATKDEEFFFKLRSALKGKTGNQARYLTKFRFLMQVLLEQGDGNLPTAEIRKLAIHLGAYAESPSAEKNLDELIRKFRKNKTISK